MRAWPEIEVKGGLMIAAGSGITSVSENLRGGILFFGEAEIAVLFCRRRRVWFGLGGGPDRKIALLSHPA